MKTKCLHDYEIEKSWYVEGFLEVFSAFLYVCKKCQKVKVVKSHVGR